METVDETNIPEEEPRTTRRIHRDSMELLERRGVHHLCEIEVRRNGRWYVFDGTVDSQSTKSKLFELVPSRDGARFIVDRLETDA